MRHLRGDAIAEAYETLIDLQAPEVLVVDDRVVLIGQVSLAQVLAAMDAGRDDEPVANIASVPGVVLEAEENLDAALQALRYFVGISVPVVADDASRKLEGVVFSSSVVGAYNDAVEQARREERGQD